MAYRCVKCNYPKGLSEHTDGKLYCGTCTRPVVEIEKPEKAKKPKPEKAKKPKPVKLQEPEEVHVEEEDEVELLEPEPVHEDEEELESGREEE